MLIALFFHPLRCLPRDFLCYWMLVLLVRRNNAPQYHGKHDRGDAGGPKIRRSTDVAHGAHRLPSRFDRLATDRLSLLAAGVSGILGPATYLLEAYVSVPARSSRMPDHSSAAGDRGGACIPQRVWPRSSPLADSPPTPGRTWRLGVEPLLLRHTRGRASFCVSIKGNVHGNNTEHPVGK